MRIALAQINTTAGDFPATVTRVAELSRQASAEHAKLLVLPVATLAGLAVPGLSSREGFIIDLWRSLQDLADCVACPCVVPVIGDYEYGGTPSLALLYEGQVVSLGDSLHKMYDRPLRDLEIDDEQGLFSWGGVRFACAYTYDDLDLLTSLRDQFDVLLFLSDQGFALDNPSSALGSALLENRYRNDAWALDAWIVAAGSLGGYDLQVFTGSSFVMNPQGDLVACAPAFEEVLLYADVMPKDNDDHATALEPELYDRSLHLWEALVLGIHDQVSKGGHSNVALVLDGRLNSCVLAALATDAVGPTHVHAYIDSCEDEEHRKLALQLAQRLHVVVHEPSLDVTYMAHDTTVRRDLAQVGLARVAREAVAIPLSSIDKTFMALEPQMGFCQSATLAPLGDVYRSDVMELAHLRNTISPVIEAVSLASYDVPPVEGLAEAETTPEARVRRVDVTLASCLEWGRTLSDVVARHGCEALTSRIVHEFADRELDRLCLPPCIVVSSCTVREARIPLGLSWHDRMRSDEERRNARATQDDASFALGGFAMQDELASEVASALGQMQQQLMSSGNGAANDNPERQMGELLGLLRDLLQEGGSGISGGSGGMPFGPLTWGSPFSEN